MTRLTKRELMGGSLAAALAAPAARAAQTGEGVALPAITTGKFDSSIPSLGQYQAPDWYRDAKFGIWAHWGPQAVPGQGDWYARWMYVPGHPHYEHHLKTYGHPSEKGYKDIIPLWTADKFDPEALAKRYAAAGAKYFVSMGVHHDNFDMWRSRHQRWNATMMGPKRDIVGDWQKAAKRQGMRFGVSEHLAFSYNWWYPNHLYDQFWPKFGTRYDGWDPRFTDLYHDNRTEEYLGDVPTAYTRNPVFHRHWFDRIKDLLDSYQPDFLYSDSGIPFQEVGQTLIAHFYNMKANRSGGTDAVYTCKDVGPQDYHEGTCVQDMERGVKAGINPRAWQTCTSNAEWFWNDNDKYKSTEEVLGILIDVVSKNGNMLLNVALRPDGSLPPESERVLDDLAPWMAVNGEAIHGTRPWKIWGEGPTAVSSGALKENGRYTGHDIRFTTKKDRLFALTLNATRGPLAIAALRKGNPHEPRRVASVKLLGGGAVPFRQTADALVIDVPASLPTRFGSAFEIRFAWSRR